MWCCALINVPFTLVNQTTWHYKTLHTAYQFKTSLTISAPTCLRPPHIRRFYTKLVNCKFGNENKANHHTQQFIKAEKQNSKVPVYRGTMD